MEYHMKRSAFAALGLLWAATLSSTAAQTVTRPDEKTIADAYVYLLGRALTIRQEHMDRAGPGFAYNAIKYNPLGSADFVNPNFDVAYLESWVALDDGNAAILEVPEVKGRYYTAQLLDEWGEVITNINERVFPSKPFGKFALIKPGSNAKIPADATPIMLHGSKAKLLGRVELKGDPDGAVKLQNQFKLASMGQPVIAAPPAIRMFDNKDLMGADIFDDVEPKLLSALDVAPNAGEMQQKVRAIAAYVATGSDARAVVDTQIKKLIPEFQDYAVTKVAPYRNHWAGGSPIIGQYGSDFWARTSINFVGIWGNNPGEVIYFGATRDADEKLLNGSNSYVIHFPADKLPENAVEGYWSVILVGVPDYRVVPNALKRYNFNNHSPLQKDPDGSLKIGIGPKPVGGAPESNWLPSAEGKPFMLTFRTYVPKDIVRQGQWQPAAVTMVK